MTNPMPYRDAVLHQRSRVPSPAKMAAAGFLIVSAIGYITLNVKAKPGTSPIEVAKVVAGSTPK